MKDDANRGVISVEKMAEIEDWVNFTPEEERLEYEEEMREEDELSPVEWECGKCGDRMMSTRIEDFSVPAYQHTFSGDKRDGDMTVHVCWYCLRDGWRPYRVRSNHMEIYWENVFEEDNPLLEDMLDKTEKRMLRKLRAVSETKRPDVTEYGISPAHIGLKTIYGCYKEEMNEFLQELRLLLKGESNLKDVQLEAVDHLNTLFLLYWLFDEVEDEDEIMREDFVMGDMDD